MYNQAKVEPVKLKSRTLLVRSKFSFFLRVIGTNFPPKKEFLVVQIKRKEMKTWTFLAEIIHYSTEITTYRSRVIRETYNFNTSSLTSFSPPPTGPILSIFNCYHKTKIIFSDFHTSLASEHKSPHPNHIGDIYIRIQRRRGPILGIDFRRDPFIGPTFQYCNGLISTQLLRDRVSRGFFSSYRHFLSFKMNISSHFVYFSDFTHI